MGDTPLVVYLRTLKLTRNAENKSAQNSSLSEPQMPNSPRTLTERLPYGRSKTTLSDSPRYVELGLLVVQMYLKIE